jgi:hypothetical protein
LTVAEHSALRAALAANASSAGDGLLKPTKFDTWHGPLPDFAESRRPGLVRRQVEERTARGQVQGRDFQVAPDGRALYESCL